MTQPLRLSRITTPRATFWSLLLLIVACAAFGVSASAAKPHGARTATHPIIADNAATSLVGLAVKR